MFIFPFVLIALELVIKIGFKINADTIIGPSLAAAGATFVIPLTIKKPLTLEKLDQLQKNMQTQTYNELLDLYRKGIMKFTDNGEEQVRNISIAVVLVLIVLWAITVAIAAETKVTSIWTDLITIVLGLLSCLIGFVLTEWSEDK